MSNAYYTQFFYTRHNKATLLDFNFVVDATNGNGLGIRNLKGAGIRNVFMHTSATPGSNAGFTNPNPASGVIMVQVEGNFNKFLGSWGGFVSPVGSSVTATTNHVAYVITSLGTATTAQWVAVGFPAGIAPAVGAAFIATASATIGGSATVAPSASAGAGIDHIEVLGDANQTIISTTAPTTNQLIFQCFANGVLTAPAQNSVIGLQLYFNNTASGL